MLGGLLRRRALGLDLDGTTLTAVVLRVDRSGWRIERAWSGPIRGDGLSQAVQDIGAFRGFVGLGLDGASVALRLADFPPLSQSEVRRSVELELDRYLPLQPESSVFDFATVQPAKEGGRQAVLLAGARREIVDEAVLLVREGGWSPTVLEPVVMAQARALQQLGHSLEGVAMLLDLGRYPAQLTVFQGGIPYLSRGVSEEGRQLAGSIRRSLEFFQMQSQAGPVERFYLVAGSEGSEEWEALERGLQAEFGAAGFPSAVRPELRGADGVEVTGDYLGALGLAWRGVSERG